MSIFKSTVAYQNLIKWFSKGKNTAIGLVSIIFASSFLADRFLINSQLSILLLISTTVSTIIIYWGLPKLKELNLGQIIRKEGPEQHYNKSGTPTMGGLFVIPIGLIIGNLITIEGNSNNKLIAISFLIITFMVIGALDDIKSISKKTNSGLSPKFKLLLEALCSIVFLIWSNFEGWINSRISLGMNIEWDIGVFIWPLAIFVILAESNATNLTDGLDGLAAGCGALVFAGLSIELILKGNNGDPVLAGFSIIMAGTWLGFLVHNRNPAKIFMGDAGSLAMGASLSGIAILSDNLWTLLIMGGIFLIESLSVIVQVLVYKVTKYLLGNGKRIFLMSPIHHHFEIMSIPENLIVVGFWITTLLLISICLIM